MQRHRLLVRKHYQFIDQPPSVCGTMKTAVGGGFRGDDFLKLLQLLALGYGLVSLAHLASTKQLRTWNALGVAIGVLGGLADL